jgi:hypothetical protein
MLIPAHPINPESASLWTKAPVAATVEVGSVGWFLFIGTFFYPAATKVSIKPG